MADILIRGMEMPPNCGTCPLHCEAFRNAFAFNPRFVMEIRQGRYQDCPLVPLPEGHGRLIDADALLRDNLDFADLDFCHPKYDTTLRELIDEAPTIVPAEGGGEDG